MSLTWQDCRSGLWEWVGWWSCQWQSCSSPCPTPPWWGCGWTLWNHIYEFHYHCAIGDSLKGSRGSRTKTGDQRGPKSTKRSQGTIVLFKGPTFIQQWTNMWVTYKWEHKKLTNNNSIFRKKGVRKNIHQKAILIRIPIQSKTNTAKIYVFYKGGCCKSGGAASGLSLVWRQIQLHADS